MLDSEYDALDRDQLLSFCLQKEVPSQHPHPHQPHQCHVCIVEEGVLFWLVCMRVVVGHVMVSPLQSSLLVSDHVGPGWGL